MKFLEKLFGFNKTAIPKPTISHQVSSNVEKIDKIQMMECPPFLGQAFCSDNECPCSDTKMPPAQGYLWIKPEVAATRKNCLLLSSLQGHMSESGISATNLDVIRKKYLPITVCKVSATRHKLDLEIAKFDYELWVKTGSVPCRPTPLTEQVTKLPNSESNRIIELAGTPLGTFTDPRDGKTYNKIKIGSQIWMAENLAYLPSTRLSANGSFTEPYYSVYDYEVDSISEAKEFENYKIYGVLYNWVAAIKACPEGWHLPSDAEWTILTDNLGGEVIAGRKMKNTSGWESDGNGTNASCFAGFPGGYRYNFGRFFDAGTYGGWWSSTEDYSVDAWSRTLSSSKSNIIKYSANKLRGFSVRCLLDD